MSEIAIDPLRIFKNRFKMRPIGDNDPVEGGFDAETELLATARGTRRAQRSTMSVDRLQKQRFKTWQPLE